MHKLTALALATTFAMGNSRHHGATGNVNIIVKFDNLVVKGSDNTTSIGIYNGLNFSNIWVGYQASADTIDLNGSAAYGIRSPSRNKVGVWQDEVGKSPPSFGVHYLGSKFDSFDLKSFKWGCAPEMEPCAFAAIGSREGEEGSSQSFGQDQPGGDRFGVAITEPLYFTNVDLVSFRTDPLDTNKVNGDVWIDELELILHRRGPSSLTTTAPPTKTQPVPRPLFTKSPVPPHLVLNCPDICVANSDDCGQNWGGCFDFCLSPWPTFTPPTVCTITSNGVATTGETTATTVIMPSTTSTQSAAIPSS
ncbi:hypothetical protein PFICI_02032 [Pestalotiopsis fici W106-1]|uniref:Uncharacterized protein n=1 Tax=Pestalotiopsis fici (strain W106-1 / CGMCC3.15140) TaxID=1229662 RepID=W3XQD1_PESFW|nr:uncharacterized protein PFICI_02032 [Pestalotiopsis fici W106-1]ETS88204.1 hypothetical protein PFICI_02032 [Pestalotiopsis fici W106-1]